MSRKLGWYADKDPESAYPDQWQPWVQTESINHGLEVWFQTESACIDWIRREILGLGIIDESIQVADA